MRMRKHNYGEIYNYAKQYGREKTMKTYGVSAPVLSCVIATGDDLLATMKRSSTPPTGENHRQVHATGAHGGARQARLFG